MVSKNTPIIIIGAGAFGLSTALHLVRSGYSNITVFEKDDQIPPVYSAANDLNKIVRAEYEDQFYTDLAIVCSHSHRTSNILLINAIGSSSSLENTTLCPA